MGILLCIFIQSMKSYFVYLYKPTLYIYTKLLCINIQATSIIHKEMTQIDEIYYLKIIYVRMILRIILKLFKRFCFSVCSRNEGLEHT